MHQEDKEIERREEIEQLRKVKTDEGSTNTTKSNRKGEKRGKTHDWDHQGVVKLIELCSKEEMSFDVENENYHCKLTMIIQASLAIRLSVHL